MANRIRGEISVRFNGRDYRLVLDMNALAGFEDATDTSLPVLLGRADAGTLRLSDMRHLVHQSLLRDHPDATLLLAGDMLSEDVGVFARLMEAAFPDAKENAGGNAEASAAE